MRVSWNWLKEYVDLDISPPEVAERLTLVGLEVEELADRYAYLNQVIVGRVASFQDHPQAGHLKICQVETGDRVFQVVCGAPNVRAGMHSALSLVGAELPSGALVGETEIRGVKSTGMLCSAAELMVGLDAAGIMDLGSQARPGQGLKEFLKLDDWILEVGITPNRPDCLSIIGLARELAGILGRPLKPPRIYITEGQEKIDQLTSITILAPEHCPRYVARIIRGVKIGPSPFWLVDRLTSVGLRSINNVVDVTNFVLMETGQPLHAFDQDRLVEGRIVVQTAQEGDRFTTLDGTERILGPEMLLIRDAERGVALAGIMGGLNSEISNDTTNVLLESAYFNPVSTRRTSKTLGLSTEASFRFERGIDPNVCLMAADRAAALMVELAGGTIAAGIIDANPIPHKKVQVPFSPVKCNAFLGSNFSPEMMAAKLAGIGLEVTGEPEAMTIQVPSFRVDLTREVDLYEEVARLIGFDQVPATIPPARAPAAPMDPSRILRAQAREVLIGLGLTEIITYSFIAEDFCDRLGIPPDGPQRKTVNILNPLSADQALMRTSLVPGLLETFKRNQAFGVVDVGIFELGKIFLRVDGQDLPEERMSLGGLLAGNRTDLDWHQKPEPVDFYDIKGVVEDLLANLNVLTPVFENKNIPMYYDLTTAAVVSAGGRNLGRLGRLTAKSAKAFDLRETGGGWPFIFELDLAAILEVRQGETRFKALPRYPVVSRDMAIILKRETQYADLIDFINSLGEGLLTAIHLFDAYEGPQVGPGKKSLALRLVYRSYERTLTDEEVNVIHERIADRIIQTFSAEFRI